MTKENNEKFRNRIAKLFYQMHGEFLGVDLLDFEDQPESEQEICKRAAMRVLDLLYAATDGGSAHLLRGDGAVAKRSYYCR